MGKKVILVEDDRELNMITRIVLEDEGYEVSAFQDAESALEHMNSNDFDIIVTDYKLPNMNGLDLLKRIDGDAEKFMVTAYGDNNLKAEAQQLGINYIFEKPFVLDELVERLERKKKNNS